MVYAADRDSPFPARCRDWPERQRERTDAWFKAWPILYEFLRVTTHSRVMRKLWDLPAAWSFAAGLLASRAVAALAPTQRHPDVAAQVVYELPDLAGNVTHDAHTTIFMREHGIRRVCSRETDFHRFPLLEVIDPLA